jgi:uncharacterized membrane protein YvbJ
MASGMLGTLDAMGKCANCGVSLDPAWKFCIMCGTAVATRDNEAAAPSSPPHAERIPAVIRPVNLALDEDLDDEIPTRKKLDVALIFGIAMAAGGVVLIIAVAIALFTPRG